ncbi:cupin domain-containing protein [Acutalibacter sp. 1XD8-33]|uniref:cupin domain-containing protein n=1 Tax=Acutalibacter sp. 1XD8-33 TaxID=2320081 RepID=UPI001FA9994E|nr:cupin domain-containing protein [Acutalibacter sp. 1XD8-33]
MEGFITPEGHRNFLAKKLFDHMGAIQWGALAYIEKDGGGPEGNHTHPEDHIFIVAEGQVEVLLGERSHTVKKDEMFYVDGMTPHSIWNREEETAKVVKISVKQEEPGR